MYNKQALRETYNKIAEDWHKDHLVDEWWQGSAEYFARLLPGGGSVLDVGCAGGVKTEFFNSRGFPTIGIDLSEKMIELAQRNYPGLDFKVLDMREVPSLGLKYDGIYALASLLHIPKNEVVAVLRAWAECLKPGGLLFVGVKEQRENQPEEDIVEESDYGYAYERFFSYFKLKELKAYFVQAGFEVIHEQINGNRWIKLIGRKI